MSFSKGSSSPLMTIKNELLHGAVVKGDLPTVKRLLDRHKADINTKNSNGLSMLQIALLNGHSKLSEYLIQKGVDIHSTDQEGFSALHDAALEGDLPLVRKLLSKGLSPLLVTQMGELAIDLAANMQVEKMVCEEMYRTGEVKLAKEYSIYLGLEREMPENFRNTRLLMAARGCHSHFAARISHAYQGTKNASQQHPSSSQAQHSSQLRHEAQTGSVKSQFQVSKNLPTRANRVHPSADVATQGAADSASLRERQPWAICDDGNCLTSAAARVGSPPNCDASGGSHANAGYAEASQGLPAKVYKEQASSEDKEASIVENPSPPPPLAAGDHLAAAGVNNTNTDIPTSCVVNSASAVACTNSPASAKSSVKSSKLPSCESNRGSGSNLISREATTIKSLYQHNSFQLQIGLSLHSHSTRSCLDEVIVEDPLSLSCSHVENLTESRNLTSSLPTFNSPSVITRRQKSLTVPGYSTARNKANLQHNRQKRPRTLQKSVSFADLPMTRSKAMFVGQSGSRNSSSSVPHECGENQDVATQKVVPTTSTASPSNSSGSGKSHTSIVDHRLSLPTDIYDHFIKRQEVGTRVKNSRSFDEIDSLMDAGIRALSLKPRKSIIAPPRRRRTTVAEFRGGDRRRRSVTFQPEVLLQEIVTDGDVKAVSEILESGMISDVNKMSPSGLTALHQSAIDGNLECAKALVEKGADVNCTDCESWTPLHAAVMNECTEFVRFLITSGANPNLKNDAGETPYDMAKSRTIRKMLLHAMNGKSIDGNDFSDGEYSGEEEEEYSHAESESDDDTEGDGSGLFEATNEEKKSLKERLGLTHNSALNNSSPSPDLDSVFSPSSPSSSSQVQFQNRERELTDSTSSYGSLFEPEAEVRKSSPKTVGSSVSSQQTTTGSKTLESDTDKISESGISTMEGSSDCSHRSRVHSSEDDEVSLDSDLDPDSFDYKFQEACLYCDVERALKLVRHKKEIDINRVNRTSGITALHHSVLEENFALVQHLVKDFGADVHAIDIDGWTPLHAASAVGNIQIAQFLLDKGAKVSSLNNQCELPVDVAEDEAIEKLLKKFMSLKK